MGGRGEHTVGQSRREEVAVSHHAPHDDWPGNVHLTTKQEQSVECIRKRSIIKQYGDSPYLLICSSCHIYEGFLRPEMNTRHLLLQRKK